MDSNVFCFAFVAMLGYPSVSVITHFTLVKLLTGSMNVDVSVCGCDVDIRMGQW